MKIEAIIPKNAEEIMARAKYYYSIPFIKRQYKDIGEVFLCIDVGMSVGFSPPQAIQNISIINGRLSVWGDAMPAIVFNSGNLQYHNETIEGSLEDGTANALCIVQRKGFEKRTWSFSIDDAKKAGLWKYGTKDPRQKTLPWVSYPLRMLKIRARTFAFRDTFADSLMGLTSTEEAMDIPSKEVPSKPVEQKTSQEKEQKPLPTEKKQEVSLEISKESAPKNKIKVCQSNIFGEKYIYMPSGEALMESGVKYTKAEISNLINMEDEDRKKYHSEKISNTPEKDKVDFNSVL